MAAEEFSFNPAAQRLRIAQAHLSNQTKQSEEEPAVQLFERTGRGVRMIEAGEALLEEARRIFVQVDRTVSIARHMGYAKVSRLIFGFVPSASTKVLPPIARAFTDRFPKVELFPPKMRPDCAARRLRDRVTIKIAG